MPKQVLAVDFDDVIASFNATYARHHNETYGSTLSYHDITTFDMCKVVYGIDQATLLERVRTFCHQHHDLITPIDGATDIVPRLAETYELHIVTSCCESLSQVSLEWLEAYGLNVFTEHHFANGFGSLFPERKRSKLAVCQAIGAQYLIEDAPENARQVAEGSVPVLVPWRPWNRELEPHANITSDVRDWKHIEEILST